MTRTRRGRPAKPAGQKYRIIGARVPPELWEWLQEVPVGMRSMVIAAGLERELERLGVERPISEGDTVAGSHPDT